METRTKRLNGNNALNGKLCLKATSAKDLEMTAAQLERGSEPQLERTLYSFPTPEDLHSRHEVAKGLLIFYEVVFKYLISCQMFHQAPFPYTMKSPAPLLSEFKVTRTLTILMSAGTKWIEMAYASIQWFVFSRAVHAFAREFHVLWSCRS